MKIVDLLEYKLSPKQKQNAIDNKATIIVIMPPQMFLSLTTKDYDPEYAYANAISSIESRAKSKEEYQKFINQGEILVHPFLDVDEKSGKIISHEGRARAVAALKNGDKDYEVAIRIYPPSRQLSIKDVPEIWSGQFNPNFKINFRAEVAKGTIKILNDNVQKQYQRESEINEEYEFPKSLSADQVVDMVYDLHSNIDAWEEGGPEGKIYQYNFYELKHLPISRLNLSRYTLNKKLLDKYTTMYKNTKNYPPIIYDPKHNEIIDGNHRANVLKLAGEKYIWAYVGTNTVNEAYVFDKTGRMIDDTFNQEGIHPRCTNITLKAFGICSNEKLYNNLAVIKHLKEAGYNILDLGLIKMTYDAISRKETVHEHEGFRFKTLPAEEKPLTGKWAGKYYNWSKIKPYIDAYNYDVKPTIGAFMRKVHNGKFVVGTRNHAMALIDGKLYDYENKGPNKRIMTQCYMIATDSEMQDLLQDTPTFRKDK